MTKLRFLILPLVLFCWVLADGARAEDAPPRIGRISVADGNAALKAAGDEWSGVAVNDPIAAGMSLRTADRARVKLRIGADTVALAPATRIEIGRLEHRVMHIVLPQGRIGIHLARIEPESSVEIELPRGGLWLLAPGDYDIFAGDEKNLGRVIVLEGRAQYVASGMDSTLAAGSKAMLIGPNEVTERDDRPANEFVAWWRPDGDKPEPQALRFVSAEITGYDALDGNGHWEEDKGYGPVWLPDAVPRDWAPYRYGHWRWLSAWGWTWIDDLPWGFAPSHYGRWARLPGSGSEAERWAWVPGARRDRLIYVPAAVAFLGTAGVGLSYPDSNGPAIAWFPLAPGEVYWPSYTVDLDAIREINASAVADPTAIEAGANGKPPALVANADYRHRRFASVVPRPVFAARRAVAPALIQLPDRRLDNAPLLAGSPQIPPTIPRRQRIAPAVETLGRILVPRPATPVVHVAAVARGSRAPHLAASPREAFRAKIQVAQARVAAANAARIARWHVQVAAVARRSVQ
jgi:hypothetical protein